MSNATKTHAALWVHSTAWLSSKSAIVHMNRQMLDKQALPDKRNLQLDARADFTKALPVAENRGKDAS